MIFSPKGRKKVGLTTFLSKDRAQEGRALFQSEGVGSVLVLGGLTNIREFFTPYETECFLENFLWG